MWREVIGCQHVLWGGLAGKLSRLRVRVHEISDRVFAVGIFLRVFKDPVDEVGPPVAKDEPLYELALVLICRRGSPLTLENDLHESVHVHEPLDFTGVIREVRQEVKESLKLRPRVLCLRWCCKSWISEDLAVPLQIPLLAIRRCGGSIVTA